MTRRGKNTHLDIDDQISYIGDVGLNIDNLSMYPNHLASVPRTVAVYIKPSVLHLRSSGRTQTMSSSYARETSFQASSSSSDIRSASSRRWRKFLTVAECPVAAVLILLNLLHDHDQSP
jgi:hypothetical protein